MREVRCVDLFLSHLWIFVGGPSILDFLVNRKLERWSSVDDILTDCNFRPVMHAGGQAIYL